MTAAALPSRRRKLRAWLAAPALAACALLAAGCVGYRLGPIKPTALANIHTIAVPVFQNNTLEPRIEALVTDTVIKQLQLDGTYKITTSDKADAVLQGKIELIRRQPARSVRGNVLATSELNLYINLSYTLTATADLHTLQTGNASGYTNIFIGSDLQQEERQAIPIATENAANELVRGICEGF